MLPLCADQGVAVMPWSPLARGRLTRDYNATSEREESDTFGKTLYGADADRAIIDAVANIANARGVSRAQIALAWLLNKPVITSPIIGASKPKHLEDAVAALSIKLTEEEIKALESPYLPHAVAGHK